MTVYARSDIAAVSISAAHGGVAHSHSRPVEDGAPVKLWPLTCDQPGCEDYLRSDPCWSATSMEIPETYDETKAREQSEKSGKLDRENQLAAAITELGKLGQLPEALGQVLASVLGGTAPLALVGKTVCPQCGYDNTSGAKFCNECASPMSRPATAGALGGPQRPAEPPVAAPSPLHGDRPFRIQDLRHDELQAACRGRGLPDEGFRKELMKRLRSAGVTNADLQALLVAA